MPPFHIARPKQPPPPESLVISNRLTRQVEWDGWKLLGSSFAPQAHSGTFAAVSLFWRATRDHTEPVEAQLRLQGAGGKLVAEEVINLPKEARAGDLIESRSGIGVSPRLDSGRYELALGGNEWVSLGELNVQGRARVYTVPAITHPRQVQLGGAIELLGYEINSDPVRPGKLLKLKLIWRAKQPPDRAYKVFIHVLDANNTLVAQSDAMPGNWALPTDIWTAGEVILDLYAIPIPPDAVPGEYTLQVGMYDPDNGQRLAAVESGARLANDSIGLTRVAIQ
jgi:hypothetical protein